MRDVHLVLDNEHYDALQTYCSLRGTTVTAWLDAVGEHLAARSGNGDLADGLTGPQLEQLLVQRARQLAAERRGRRM